MHGNGKKTDMQSQLTKSIAENISESQNKTNDQILQQTKCYTSTSSEYLYNKEHLLHKNIR